MEKYEISNNDYFFKWKIKISKCSIKKNKNKTIIRFDFFQKMSKNMIKLGKNLCSYLEDLSENEKVLDTKQ